MTKKKKFKDESQLSTKKGSSLLAEGVSAWTGGVEGMKDGKKKDRSDRSVWRGERCVGRFSQLPTLLWILRFKGLVFFLSALRGSKATKENDENDRFSFLFFFTCFNILSWFQKKEIGSIVFPHLNKAMEEKKNPNKTKEKSVAVTVF